MGQVADGGASANASVSESDAGDSSTEPPSRGFLGRIFEVFSSSEAEPTPMAVPVVPAVLPGMGNLRRMRVGDVAIPKVEIVAVPVTVARDELVEVFRAQGYSRLPVFKDTLDTPLGLIHLKDLALEYGFGASGGRFSLRKLLRPLLYVPPSMPIGVLLQKMQVQRIHMALVIDEYGGVDGLVTLEDLIEQVIGEIEDEHDEAEDGYWKLEKPGQWLVQARAPLKDFEAEIGMSLADPGEDQDIDSMGGLVFMQIGRVPARGEVVVGENGIEYEIVDADPRRIKRLRVRLPGVAPAE
ncbi:hemolysin family protein [Sedimentimonas flavescens]|uniref:Hemolysin family protein n=1 Tax=Sedimentimonas flavescens TaxID=2851012 RepID=A0ABT2ZVG6_9RHOB|nr:hemolysin family protein [Sedimentimonas flavescens]MBW0158363.1 hemolysin family protein [Sedimentimonas flavescens]MCT2538903.1 hemolysin family protein [Sedimentimonas flavescens]MCV2877735.1 hemolysin family protein [Sedimentimonas flavescens]WBL34083.1 hemolysin family protein [Sinirhodobacter sp. HNIBRBA609]